MTPDDTPQLTAVFSTGENLYRKVLGTDYVVHVSSVRQHPHEHGTFTTQETLCGHNVMWPISDRCKVRCELCFAKARRIGITAPWLERNDYHVLEEQRKATMRALAEEALANGWIKAVTEYKDYRAEIPPVSEASAGPEFEWDEEASVWETGAAPVDVSQEGGALENGAVGMPGYVVEESSRVVPMPVPVPVERLRHSVDTAQPQPASDAIVAPEQAPPEIEAPAPVPAPAPAPTFAPTDAPVLAVAVPRWQALPPRPIGRLECPPEAAVSLEACEAASGEALSAPVIVPEVDAVTAVESVAVSEYTDSIGHIAAEEVAPAEVTEGAAPAAHVALSNEITPATPASAIVADEEIPPTLPSGSSPVPALTDLQDVQTAAPLTQEREARTSAHQWFELFMFGYTCTKCHRTCTYEEYEAGDSLLSCTA